MNSDERNEMPRMLSVIGSGYRLRPGGPCAYSVAITLSYKTQLHSPFPCIVCSVPQHSEPLIFLSFPCLETEPPPSNIERLNFKCRL